MKQRTSTLRLRSPDTVSVTLEEAVHELQNASEAALFLETMLSTAELAKLRNRWLAYQLRTDGLTLKEIAKRANIAIATATRAAALRRTGSELLDVLVMRANAREHAS